MLFFGDSITDNFYPVNYPDGSTHYLASGMYADMVAAKEGALRLNQAANDPGRAAISSTTLTSEPLITQAGNDSFNYRVAPFDPDILVVYYGTNDYKIMDYTDIYGKTYDLNTWREAWESFYEQVRSMQKPPEKIYIIGLATIPFPPLFGGGIPSWAKNIEDLESQMDKVTSDEAARYHAVFVPIRSGMTPDMYNPMSRQHPNLAGHVYIANRLLAAMGVPDAYPVSH